MGEINMELTVCNRVSSVGVRAISRELEGRTLLHTPGMENEARRGAGIEAHEESPVDRCHRAICSSRGGRRPIDSFGRRLLACVFVCFTLSAHAALQFDVFLGYGGQPTGTDGVVREAGWFPVACEVFNDGPSFNGVFELSAAQMGGGQTRRFAVELPTNTRKRFVVPAFASSGTYGTWDARLLDQRGRVRAEKLGLRPRGMAWESVLMGAIPRTFGGLPKLPELRGNNNRSPSQPLVARLPVELFPGDPVSLEGLDALYLNSEKALELKVDQVSALLTWVYGGGHLIVGVEQPSDVNATPWLRSLLPMDLTDTATRKANQELDTWLRQRPDENRLAGIAASRNRSRTVGSVGAPFVIPPEDAECYEAEFAVATGVLRDGRVTLSVQQTPLIVTATRGRGQVSVLSFSPEREPFRSWKNREWFWAKMLGIPAVWFGNDHLNFYGGSSVDGVFGAMIDSRQVRKLPVHWLLLLLVVYLLVIGPVDQYCLKKAGRQMLTWLTFPCYVVLFSLLIYYIGYKLRAGETEWNELNIVDLLPHGERAEWRGRTYASVYSPINARYKLAGEQPVATLRGEFMGFNAGSQEGSRADVWQRGRGFDAEIFVPVWTSQLFVSDWAESGENSISATVTPQGRSWQVSIRNRLPRELREVRLALQDRLYDIGRVPAGGSTNLVLGPAMGTPLRDFVVRQGSRFQVAVSQRQFAFGDDSQRRLDLDFSNALAVSFISQVMNLGQNQRGFVYPAGLDLSSTVERGDAVLLAWIPDYSPADQPLNRFKTIRSRQSTLFRLAIPVGQPEKP